VSRFQTEPADPGYAERFRASIQVAVGTLEDLPEEFLRQVLQQIEAQAAAIAAKQIEGGASVVPAAAQTVDVAHAPSGQS
jgi:phosphoserine phosphatase